jgi:hypothetical protein
VEDQDNIACHSFVSDDDFFTAIYNEIPALIKSTLFRVSSDFSLIKVFKVAKFGAYHDWNFPEENLFITVSKKLSLFVLFIFSDRGDDWSESALNLFGNWSFGLAVLIHTDVNIDLSGVGHVPQTGFMREKESISIV